MKIAIFTKVQGVPMNLATDDLKSSSDFVLHSFVTDRQTLRNTNIS